jgi:hypothetical protein
LATKYLNVPVITHQSRGSDELKSLASVVCGKRQSEPTRVNFISAET